MFTSRKKDRPFRIDLYATCWNEERMIPFFLRHYEPIVDRMIIFDDGSTDRSTELLSACPKVELRQLPRGESSILMQQEETNRCWKESRENADWVVICDIDEHFYHERGLRSYLEQCKTNHTTIVNPVGVNVISGTFPDPNDLLCQTLRRGVRSSLLDKMSIFNPDAIDEINYTPGLHTCRPVGRVVFPPRREVMLLHYKCLGPDYLVSRSADLRTRKTPYDRERGWGLHDHRPANEIRLHFAELLAAAEDISAIRKKKSAST